MGSKAKVLDGTLPATRGGVAAREAVITDGWFDPEAMEVVHRRVVVMRQHESQAIAGLSRDLQRTARALAHLIERVSSGASADLNGSGGGLSGDGPQVAMMADAEMLRRARRAIGDGRVTLSRSGHHVLHIDLLERAVMGESLVSMIRRAGVKVNGGRKREMGVGLVAGLSRVQNALPAKFVG